LVPSTTLFPIYKQRENRITASIVAVFERIETDVVVKLLKEASGEDASYITFVNQVGEVPGSVPDARIQAKFRYLFEVKVDRDALRVDQLDAHVAALDGSFGDERLYVITPDRERSALLDRVETRPGAKVLWFSFAALADAIDSTSSDIMISNQTRFLLAELGLLLETEGLTRSPLDVVIVAANLAWPVYKELGAYLCQSERYFRQVEWMGFYADGAIQRIVPRILGRLDPVEISRKSAGEFRAAGGAENQKLARVIEAVLDKGLWHDGDFAQVFLLSDDDRKEQTLILPHAIHNSNAGAGRAWTQNQRYTSQKALMAYPRYTSGLVEVAT